MAEETKVIDTPWADSIKAKFEEATADVTEADKKSWMIDRIVRVAYHLEERPECSSCKNYMAEIESLYEYYIDHKNASYEERREFITRFATIFKHLNADHKMVNKGQYTVLGAIIGVILGIIGGFVQGSTVFLLIVGILAGLFLGRIYEIRAEHDHRIL